MPLLSDPADLSSIQSVAAAAAAATVAVWPLPPPFRPLPWPPVLVHADMAFLGHCRAVASEWSEPEIVKSIHHATGLAKKTVLAFSFLSLRV